MNGGTSFVLDKVKSIVERMPGILGLNKIRHDIIRIVELSDLIRGNKIAVLHPYCKMEGEVSLAQGIVYDVVKDFIDVYGTVRLRRRTAGAMASRAGMILLYAPLALLRIPSSHEEYLAKVGSKTRNMIRKAARHRYEFGAFSWNDYLDEIYEINTSKDVRQSTPMRGWYLDQVQPRYHSKEEQEYRKYYGAFKDGKLCAYLHAVLCGDFAFFRHFMGHGQHLPYGVMNGLISWTVREYVGSPYVRWLKYGELSKAQSTMHQFRKHAGFQGFATFLDIESDGDLRKYAEQKVKTIWRL